MSRASDAPDPDRPAPARPAEVGGAGEHKSRPTEVGGAGEGRSPPAVSRFEYTLLRLLRFVLGAMPAEQALLLVNGEFTPAPPCLTRTCVRLAEDTLAKGTVLTLVRAGGWRRDRFLKGGEPKEGRAWDRVELPARTLEFSGHPLAFLMWLTAEKPLGAKKPWDCPPSELTPADQLFFALALDALRAVEGVGPVLAKREAFSRNPFCWLFTPGDFAEQDEPRPPDFAPCFTGVRAVMLECLQHRLGERWARSERGKGQVSDWKRMRGLGRAEQAALSGYLAAAEAANRPDLARFVLHATEATLGTPGEITPAYWTGGLQGSTPPRLADRIDTQRLALAVPAQLATLARWERAARSVGYFDEGYAASQLWKADWDKADGDRLARRAADLIASLDPLKT